MVQETAWSFPAALSAARWTTGSGVDEGMRFLELDERIPGQANIIASIRSLCSGVSISRVIAVDNPALEARFAAQHSLMSRICLSSGFNPSKFAQSATAEQKAVLNALNEWMVRKAQCGFPRPTVSTILFQLFKSANSSKVFEQRSQRW